MPRHYRRKRKQRRKRRSRQSYGSPNVVLNNVRPAPLGTTFKMKMAYSEPTITLDAAAGLLADYVYSANGIFDPNITGVGHQPLGFDEIKNMYDHYVVIGCRIVSTFINVGSDTMQVGISLKDNATAVQALTDLIENGSGKTSTLGPFGSSSDSKTISMNVNPNRFLGRSHPLSDPELKGASDSNPVEQAYLHVWAGAVTGDNPSAIQVSNYLEYTVIWLEPVQLVGS